MELDSGSKNRFPPGAPPGILEKKKELFDVYFVNILCGKSYFGKKSVSFFGDLPTLNLSFEASSKPFFDRLDIFPDAIDLKNTMAVSILVLHRPLVRSEKSSFFFSRMP